MALETATDPAGPKTFVRGGLALRAAERLGFEPATWRRRRRRVLLLFLVTWAPLFVLSVVSGRAWGDLVAEPLLFDPVVFSRFFFVVPLLELAQIVVEKSLRVQMHHFVESGLLPLRQVPDFDAAAASAARLRQSVVAEVAIAIASVMICVMMRVVIRDGTDQSSWERSGTAITPAGWWYILVSLPILGFFLLRWVWIYLLWAGFLFRVSRLDLELTATHADRSGGLGFLGWSLASYAPVLMAVSAVLSGALAREILHGGQSLDSLKYHILVFVILAIGFLHLPLVCFSALQARCRFRGLLDFGTLLWRHDRQFDEAFIKPLATSDERLLGSPAISTLASIGQVYEHVDRMRLVAFDKNALVMLVVAALIPMVPLLGTTISITEILSMLGKLMV